ncbi:hypothetical protein EST38_g11703 [Candolleomyces aberdarensis]|uniref:Extracellular metalloproteinase n=1 Tax=Candolleomyces aberdarensis TaxID=2316362 RepID=A0A4Q2D477_9AGAR|nr:hypothetical protein EST38_g11703 [Candolleomyces aberdarensis]
MAPLGKLLSSVFLALAWASATSAAPGPLKPHTHSTHHTRSIGTRGLQVEVYNPPSSFETFGEGLAQPESFAGGGLSSEARSFVSNRLRVDQSTVEYRSGFEAARGTRHAYVRQRANGIPFANAVANVAFKGNRVVTFGSSFVRPSRIASATPTVDLQSVLPTIEEQLEGKWNNHPASLEYLARPDGTAALAHVVQIQNLEANTWYEAFVDAHSGELLSVTDFSAEASYRVLPLTKQDLREGLELLVDPHDPLSSPDGWHSGTTVTAGNNVVAYKGTQASTTSQSADGLVFDYTYNTAVAPAQAPNVDAARTNAFYAINTVHDIAYRYGFTEASFNFQNDNFGKGGSGNDRVLMSVQDSSGTNNANFATPPDGQSGTCRMYIWTTTSPNRDGSLNNDIIVHEMTHGITNRLTGGGTARCLQTTESRGMGEGWSDALAEWTEQKSEVIADFVLAPYVTNNPAGIRTRPYSTNSTTNPLRYSNVAGQSVVHRIGEIWANILHNVYASLVGQYGWSPVAFTNIDGREGNIVYAHLFFDSLALQPCNPTFVQARDAWIQADLNRYDGANKCLLWAQFASKGLGVNARNFVDDFSVPADC